MIKTLLNAGFILAASLMVSCSQSQKENEPVTESQPESAEAPEQKEAPVAYPESVSDTIFIGFRFGMSLAEAKEQAGKLKEQGEKINLSGNADKLSGEYMLNNGKSIASSQMTILFVKDKLSEIQVEIKCDKREDHSVTDGLLDLAGYLAPVHGPYQTGEDTMHYEYYFWDDGNRMIKVFQSDGHHQTKCLYNILFKDSRLDGLKES